MPKHFFPSHVVEAVAPCVHYFWEEEDEDEDI